MSSDGTRDLRPERDAVDEVHAVATGFTDCTSLKRSDELGRYYRGSG